MTRKPILVVVGFGRLGSALARGLRTRWEVRVVSRTGAAAQRVRRAGFRLATEADLRSAAICFLAVPDAVIASAARELVPRLGRRTALVHGAGALSLRALPAQRQRGSFHPLCAISPGSSLAGHAVAIAASTPALSSALRKMARQLGLWPFAVPDGQRALYHAGAVLSAGAAIALAACGVEALEAAGVDPKQAERALLSLMASAVAGAQARGLKRGLTGPIPRGDVATVRAHLAVLPASVLPVYRALMHKALPLVRGQLPQAVVRELARILEKNPARHRIRAR